MPVKQTYSYPPNYCWGDKTKSFNKVKKLRNQIKIISSCPSKNRRQINLSICLIGFLLITFFSLSMLVLTQFLLSSNTLEPGNLYNFSSNDGLNLFAKINSHSTFENYLASFNDSYEIKDYLLSPSSVGFSDVNDQINGVNSLVQNPNDHWQPVRSSSNKFYLFSSYIDSFNRSNMNNYLELNDRFDNQDFFVRIIAVTMLASKEKIICGFYLDQQSWFREGKMKPIREHWNLQYSAFFIYCPVPKKLVKIERKNENNTEEISLEGQLSLIAVSALWHPSDLGLLLKQNAQFLRTIVPSNRMRIHPLILEVKTSNQTKIPEMAVCVKPLHYHYNKTINLLEFIELNKLLGVQRFYFYNHTIDWQVDHILRMYQLIEPSLIHVLQWRLPIKSQTQIRTEGIFAALNDCLYRAKTNRFTYVIFIDLDEFIIPYHHRTLTNLMKDVRHIYHDKVGAYSFRNGFFYLQYPNDQLESIYGSDRRLSQNLVTLTKTLRKVDLNVHKQRSKCIVFTDYTIEMGNHFVWEFTYGKHTLNIDPNIAYLHHYRVCEFGGDGCIHKTERVLDRRAHYWSNSLLKAIRNHLEWFCDAKPFDVCSLIQS